MSKRFNRLILCGVAVLIVLIGCQTTPQNVVPEEGVLLTPPTPTIEVVSAPVTDTQTLVVTPSSVKTAAGEVALYQVQRNQWTRASAIC